MISLILTFPPSHERQTEKDYTWHRAVAEFAECFENIADVTEWQENIGDLPNRVKTLEGVSHPHHPPLSPSMLSFLT